MSRHQNSTWIHTAVCLGLFCCSAGAANYYVNDAATVGDIWCTAPGVEGNDGLTPATPALRFQAIVDLYDLGGGDLIRVDTGTYNLSANIIIPAADSGSSTSLMVTVLGSTNGASIHRGSSAGAACAFHLDQADYIRLDGLRISGAGQGIRIENAEYALVTGCDVYSCRYGIVLAGGSGHRIENGTNRQHAVKGLYGSLSAGPRIAGNAVYEVSDGGSGTSDHAIELFSCASPEIRANTIRNNGGDGVHLASCSSAAVSDNEIYSHGGNGVYLYGCSSISLDGNAIHDNDNGVSASSSPDLAASDNHIYSNSGRGLSFSGGDGTAEHNVIYANSGGGLYADDPGGSTIRNNTFYQNTGAGVQLAGFYEFADVRNNIFFSAGATQWCLELEDIETTWYSDYNTFFTTNRAAAWYWRGARFLLSSWQNYTDRDRHSLVVNPLFVDPDGADNILGGANGDDDDFHIQSTVGSYHGGVWTTDPAMSPCMDAGDPESDFSIEPAVNGGRVNQGAYGNTAQASKSTSNRVLRVLYPNGGEIGFRRYRVRWAATGPWLTNDDVKVQYSANGGTAWTDCAAANPLDYDNSLYGWDIRAMAPGTQYLIRIVYLGNTNVYDDSNRPFEVLDPSPKILYVNDGSTVNDQWCTATGGVANTGLSGASPLDSLDHTLEVYPETGAGDEIRMDTGTHDSDRMIYITSANSGAAGSNLTIRGSSTGAAILDGLADFDVVHLRRLDHLRMERLTITGGQRGILAEGATNDPCNGIELVDCTLYGNALYGLYLSHCTNALIQGNTCRKLGIAGIYAQGHGQVSGNASMSNGTDGIRVDGAFLVRSNVCHRNTACGIAAEGGASRIESNRCYRNDSIGVILYSGLAQAAGNTIYSNTGAGLYLSGSAEAVRNVVFKNGSYGIYAYGDARVHNNLVYSNAEFNLYMQTDGGRIENNTLVGGDGFFLGGDPNSVTSMNNIIHSSGAGRTAIYVSDPPSALGDFWSDYNDLYVSGGAAVGYWYGPRLTLEAWQAVTLRDPHSLDIDPRFGGAGSAGYHLRSTAGRYDGAPFTAPGGGVFANDADLSFCVDAGDPASDYANESAPNGGRINLGAFGNTPDASRSPGERLSLVVKPGAGDQWFGTRQITWLTRGPWAGDTVRIEYSDNGGTTWATITSGVDSATGSYSWDTGAVTPGTNYFVRVWREGGGATSVCAGVFAILASGPRTFYVNDTSTVNDVYCTAVGDDANDGLAPGAPKLTVQAILDTYNLEPGDTVRIDTGFYPLSATIVVTTNDIGAVGNPVLFVGSTHAGGSVLSRGNAAQSVMQLGLGVHYVRLELLRATGGSYGFDVEGAWNTDIWGAEIFACWAYSNTYDGIYLYYCTNATVWSNTVFANGSRGINVSSGSGDLRYNEAWSNASAGIRLSGVGIVEDNLARQNGADGVEVYGWRCGIRRNTAYFNGWSGIKASGGYCLVGNNVSYGNRMTGLNLADGAIAQSNVVHRNGEEGVYLSGSYAFELRNNLIYANCTNRPDRSNVNVESTRGLIVNNTLYGGSGIEIYDIYQITNRNNIIWSSGESNVAVRVESLPLAYEVFDSDFNDIFVTNGAAAGYWSGLQPTMTDWQFATARDQQSFAKDPLFVDPDGADDVLGGTNLLDDNFHPMSAAGSWTGLPFAARSAAAFATNPVTSWCVDAGHPSSSYAAELDPNGVRINVGAFGNTADASLSTETNQIDLYVPRGGEVVRGVKRLKWITRGPWIPGDLVRLEWTDDYKNYYFITDVPYEIGFYDWDTSGMLPFHFYGIRASKVDQWNINDLSDDFAIAGVAPLVFYVNDAFTNNDVFCTAAGSDANTGVTNSSPKLTLQGLLMDFTLIPGDTIKVDTGTYGLNASVVFRDSGSVAQDILMIGSMNGALFNGAGLDEPMLKFMSADYWRIEGLQAAYGLDNGLHVEGVSTDYCEAIEITGCTIYSNGADGIQVKDYATNILVSQNICYGNSQGIHFFYSGGNKHGEVSRNVCSNNRSAGIRALGVVHVVSNECRMNGGSGIYSDGSKVTVERNRCHENDGSGIALNYGLAVRNCAYMNTQYGILLYNNSAAEQNAVWGNDLDGIAAVNTEPARVTIRNNLVYSNSEYGIYISQSALIENNTLYGGDGIYIYDLAVVTQRNNIVWSRGVGKTAVYLRTVPGGSDSFVSDFNNLYATDGAAIGFWMGTHATMEDWRYASKQDVQTVSKDPLFVDPDGADGVLGGTNAWDDNFHLRSTAGSFTGLPFTASSAGQFVPDTNTSPCVDAADPASTWTQELSPTGLRRNLGAFGNTPDASLSPEARAVELLAVTGGEMLRGTVRLTWATTGPWEPGDHVKLMWNGTNKDWDVIAYVPYEIGYYDWDTTGWAWDHGQMRAARSNGMAQSHLTGAIDLWHPTGVVFYVNDGFTSNDVYCTAIGDDLNDGLSSNEPMATLKHLFQTYNLIPGDRIYVDTGTWILDSTRLLDNVSGAATNPIRIIGSTHPDGSLHNRSDPEWAVFYLTDCNHLALERLGVTGGKNGISVWGSSSRFCDGIRVAACTVYSLAEHGIYAGYCTNFTICSNLIHHQADEGIKVVNAGNHGVVCANQCHDNGGNGMDMSGAFVVANNLCRDNTGYGMYLSGDITAQSNTCHENNVGLYISGEFSEALDNIVYLNTVNGINARYGCDVRRNKIYSNGQHGLHSRYEDGDAVILCNNLVYDNARSGLATYYNIYVLDQNKAVIENNTMYGGHGLYLGSITAVTNRNNIIRTFEAGCYGVRVASTIGGFVSDYNNIYATGGANVGYWSAARATLAAWQTASSRDASSQSLDPLFVDPNGPDDILGGYNGDDDDFHIKSVAGSWHAGLWLLDETNSPCLDAGYPRTPFALEPAYNGLRVNQGAFGNTEQASKTAYAGPFHTVSFACDPTNGGTIAVWPEAAAYPTNVEIEAEAVPAAHFWWTNWTGSIVSTSRTLRFYVAGDMDLTAHFGAFVSNTNGVPDWWLASYNLPTNSASGDGDGDLSRDWEEYIAGTVPTNGDSVFVVEDFESPPGRGPHIIRWTSTERRVYSVDGTTNLMSSYVNLTNHMAATPPENVYTDTHFSAEQTTFYRIGVELE